MAASGLPRLGLVAFLWILGLALIWPVLPFQAMAFGATPLLVTLLFATDTAVAMLASPVAGRISDRIGRRPVIAAGLLLGAASFLVLALSDDLATVFFSRVLGGLSLSALPALQAALADNAAGDRRILGFSTYNGAYAAAFVFGPLVTWQALSWFEVSTSTVALFATFVSLSACILLTRRQDRHTDDAPAPVPEMAERTVGQQTQFRIGFLGAASLLPLIVIALLGVAHAAWDAIVGVWSAHRLDWGGAELAIGYAVTGCSAAITQFLWAPRLSRRFGEGTTSILAIFVTGGALVGLATSSQSWETLLALALFGAAVATANSCLFTLLSLAVPEDQQGAALGLAGSALGFAWLLGPLAAGVTFGPGAPGLPLQLAAAVCIFAGAALALGRRARALRRAPASETSSNSTPATSVDGVVS